jgi:hypothetical protein
MTAKYGREKVAAGTGHICGISFDVIHHDDERGQMSDELRQRGEVMQTPE